MEINILKARLITICLGTLVACSPYFHQPLRINESRLGSESSQHEDLISLPAPKEKIVAAVYKFRDQTGQYKASDVGTSWSTAVTQGSTSILLRAIEESGWFVPIERESLSNLLNERKIIRSSRATYTPGEDQSLLPPLLFAGVLLEGGIVSFDSNIRTGGAGARYFGAGASAQYREDRVTIYLRAVSTGNGRILKTVYTSKTILSQKIDVGFFRFVKVKRLLEAETGFTYNEPGEMAIKDAIEKAVIALVIEGLEEGLWQLQDTTQMRSSVIKRYQYEKTINDNVGVYGNEQRERRGRIGLSSSFGIAYLNGDYSGTDLLPNAEIGVDFPANARWSGSIRIGYGRIGSSFAYKSSIAYSDLSLRHRFFNLERFTPFFTLGFGTLYEIENNLDDPVLPSSQLYYYGVTRLGCEYLLSDYVGFHGDIGVRALLTDDLDRLQQGKFNDYVWNVNVGVSIYLGR